MPERIVVATYNIHSCIGRDQRYDPSRILRVLAEMDADIYGLQEVGPRPIWVGGADQYAYFMEQTGMHTVEGPNLFAGDARYGNMLLSRFPIVDVTRINLSVTRREPRGAIIAQVSCGNCSLRVVNTHFGLGLRERRRQVLRLEEALGADPMPTIFLGDFNMWGRERQRLARLGAPHADAVRPRTFPAWYPVLALDRIWSREGASLLEVRPHVTPDSVSASDHLPLTAVIELAPAEVSAERPVPPVHRRPVLGLVRRRLNRKR